MLYHISLRLVASFVGKLLRFVKKAYMVWRELGPVEFFRIVGSLHRRYSYRPPADDVISTQAIKKLKSNLLISIILLSDKGGAKDNHLSERSIAQQVYGGYEVIKVVYSGVALKTALRNANGEFILFLRDGDILHKNALFFLVKTIEAHPDCDLVYADEDILSPETHSRIRPYYKPDWSPDFLLSVFYVGKAIAYRLTKAARAVQLGAKIGYDFDIDFFFTFLTSVRNVCHVPKVLLHGWSREKDGSPFGAIRPYKSLEARTALTNYLQMQKASFTVAKNAETNAYAAVLRPKRTEKISIVIPTANGTALINGRQEYHIDAIIHDIFHKSTYTNLEVLVVHNGNLLAEQTRRFSRSKKISLIHYEDKVFNLSEKINLGAKHAKGDQILLLNDDIRVISPDWMERMISHAQRGGIGVVGARLFYPDMTIQHAGVVMLNCRPGHPFRHSPDGNPGYGCGIVSTRNVIAVTGACQLTPKAIFEKIGGYQLEYPMNFNDIDYCLRVLETGYRVVYEPSARLIHHEGASKYSIDFSLSKELKVFMDMWTGKYSVDKYYNPNLNQFNPYLGS